jgi:hypothetical protein
VTPWSRIVAIIALALLGLLAPHVSALALGIGTTTVVVVVAVADRLLEMGVITGRSHPAHT